MKLKKILIITLAIMCVHITGCGSEKEYAPMDEILEASLDSGLVQIGDDIFQQGGYITVNDFIKKYGKKYNTSKIDTKEKIDDDWSRYYFVENKSKDIKLELTCRQAVEGDEKVAGNAVIVGISTKNAEFMWFPTGIHRIDSGTKEEMVAFFEEQGFTFSEPDSKIPKNPRLFLTKNNYGQYTLVEENDKNDNCFLLAVQPLSTPNLYGLSPSILFTYEKVSTYAPYLRIGGIIYDDSKNTKNKDRGIMYQ